MEQPAASTAAAAATAAEAAGLHTVAVTLQPGQYVAQYVAVEIQPSQHIAIEIHLTQPFEIINNPSQIIEESQVSDHIPDNINNSSQINIDV